MVSPDEKGRPRVYLHGHSQAARTPASKAASIERFRGFAYTPGATPWNKGLRYRSAAVSEYATRSAWRKALTTVYPDRCMVDGWVASKADAHHIIPRARGGRNTMENGVLLCPNCHRLAHDGCLSTEVLQEAKKAAPRLNFVAGTGLRSPTEMTGG